MWYAWAWELLTAQIDDGWETTSSVGYFEPIIMILYHLAFSPKLSARAVAALGGSSWAFSDDLSS
ncbi:MAG TPA: hypothetical protein VF910_06180 [Candidatus Bathyarchaeia archaeon]